MNTTPMAWGGSDDVAAPIRDAARGLLGDCDLRWLAVIGVLCLVFLKLVALHP